MNPVIILARAKISHFVALIFLILVSIPKILQEHSIHIIQKPLEISIGGLSFIYEGTNHQIVYILGLSILFGLWYRTFGRPPQIKMAGK